MHMPEEVAMAADALLTAMKNTEIYQEYEKLRASVCADEVNCRLLNRFSRAQASLQMAAMAGKEPDVGTTAEFEKLSTLLYQSEEVTDYLLAQMRMQQLVASTMERITREAGIQFEIPEA